MRKTIKDILKKEFHTYLVRFRDEQALTQADMARILEMDERSFVDLDHGKTCCSALTLALYLTYCCEDPLQFLEDFRTKYEAATRVTV